MIKVTRCVEWVEPWLSDGTGPSEVRRVTEAQAIASRHFFARDLGIPLSSDSDALFDFMAVHWATQVTVIEVIPDEPSMESHFPLST